MAFMLLVMGAIAMGASPIFVRNAEVGPFVSAFWRVAIAIPVLFLWAFYEQKKLGKKINWQFPLPVFLSGVFFAGDLFFWHLAIFNTTMANATLLSCLAPVWVILFSGLFIGEPVEKNAFVGLIICLIGTALLLGSSYQLAPERLIGDIYGVITSVFFGLYFLSIRVARRNFGSGEVTFISTIVCAVILFVIALLSASPMLPKTIEGFANLVSLGVISHAGGQGLLTIALGSLSAAFSSLVIFVEAIAGAFFGWIIFNETLSTGQWIGGAAILFGVYYARPKSS